MALTALLVVSSAFWLGSSHASSLQNETLCHAAACQSELNQLQASLDVAFRRAEADGGNALTRAPGQRHYAVSGDAKEVARWAAANSSVRAAIFAKRNTRGVLEVQSIALLANDAVTQAGPLWQPSASFVLVDGADVSENDLWSRVRLLSHSSLKPKVLSYGQMLDEIHKFKGVVALISASPSDLSTTLAFIPDFVAINVQGAPDASSAPYVRPVTSVGNSVSDPDGEIISSKPGETIRLLRDKNGNPAHLRFDVDPSQFEAEPAGAKPAPSS